MTELRGNRLGINKSPEEILTLLEGVAVKYGFTTSQQRPYYIWDRTTIRQINWLSVGSLKRFLGTWVRESFPQMYTSNCGANYLRVRNNYLGFYLGRGLVIKIFLDKNAHQRHIEGVNRFNDYGFKYLKAPQIIDSALDPMPHIVENYITGDNYQVIPLVIEENVIEELAEFHLDRVESINVELADNQKEQIIIGSHSLGFNDDQIKLIRNFLARSNWNTLIGNIHGDLNRGNLIHGSDFIFLTDWEFYSRGPIAQDLVKFYLQAGEELRNTIQKIYQQKFDSLMDQFMTETFISSLLNYSLRSLLTLYTSSKDQLENVFNDQNQIKKKITDYERSLFQSIQSLLNINYE